MPSRAGRGLALVRREVRFDTGGRLYGAVPGLRSLPGFARARSARRDLAGPPADRTTCPGGEIGRRASLRSWCPIRGVRVQVPPRTLCRPSSSGRAPAL